MKIQYSFLKNFLKYMYPNAYAMDSMKPINEKIDSIKFSKKLSAPMKKVKISKRINKTYIASFMSATEYAGITFSFQ